MVDELGELRPQGHVRVSEEGLPTLLVKVTKRNSRISHGAAVLLHGRNLELDDQRVDALGVGREGGEHVGEGVEGQGTGILDHEGVFVSCLLCVRQEGGRVEPDEI